MRHIKYVVSIIALLCIVFCAFSVNAAINGESIQVTQIQQKPDVATTAYIRFDKEFQGEGITAYAGLQNGIKDPADPNWSEISSEDGITARKVYKENFIIMNMD